MTALFEGAARWKYRCTQCGEPILTDKQSRITKGTGHYHAECWHQLAGAPGKEEHREVAFREEAHLAGRFGPIHNSV